jgi:hypothetical protein
MTFGILRSTFYWLAVYYALKETNGKTYSSIHHDTASFNSAAATIGAKIYLPPDRPLK